MPTNQPNRKASGHLRNPPPTYQSSHHCIIPPDPFHGTSATYAGHADILMSVLATNATRGSNMWRIAWTLPSSHDHLVTTP
mmetsp:Transcript_33636/g.74471  ORF Transcript_33636/g.74471 Transcript_33636/m.74471 type:complete len:81 (+) Transcript_33636:120-362(+)